MNSRVIKFVAGAGKTTFSEKYMKENKNGLYLAFNNSVVDELKNKGFLCKTIDSLFTSFIIPKLTSVIPLIASGAIIKYKADQNLNSYQKGYANIKIHEDGKIFNKSKDTYINLETDNVDLYSMGDFKSSLFIKSIFAKDTLNLNDQLRAELSYYIIKKYPKEIVKFLEKRFSYIIIDEAQDLKSYREEFAKLLYNSNINLIILGDDNQNINGGGIWFESLKPNLTEKKTYRCSENICKWIRDNLEIEIFGTENEGEYIKIENADVLKYDDGKRELLYYSNAGSNKEIIKNWKGKKQTIKSAKGSTIRNDIIIIGEKLGRKNLYTAITRTTKSCYSTIKKY
ncbi:MAG: UvrD-helicase domain-containing protein [Clostridia bacterium]